MYGDVFREKLQLCTWRGTKAVYMETFSERKYIKLCTGRRFQRENTAVYMETFSERNYSCVHGEELKLCTWRRFQRETTALYMERN